MPNPHTTSKAHKAVAVEISMPSTTYDFGPTDTFVRRHLGSGPAERAEMLATLGLTSLRHLVEKTVPSSIRLKSTLKLEGASPRRGEAEVVAELATLAGENKVARSCIGQGYYDTFTPAVVARGILQNPGWYTQYTPYQAEISQGRLEALINFQTMVCDLTGLPLAGSSLLDEGTAAAEAMAMARGIVTDAAKDTFLVADNCHPQTIAVVRTRAESLGIEVQIVPAAAIAVTVKVFGVLVQYPGTDGRVLDVAPVIKAAKAAGAVSIVATDLLALTLLTPPGEMGADIAVGSAQRFGVPMGFGGPHAGFLSTKTEHARRMPGRMIGLSRDSHGNHAYRLALQTREQHIRREKATSNICTAQVLLAVTASMYACYHGLEGLKAIARRTHLLTCALAAGIERIGHEVITKPFFDTITVRLVGDLAATTVIAAAAAQNINLRFVDSEHVAISLDETTTPQEVERIIGAFAAGSTFRLNIEELAGEMLGQFRLENRTAPFMTHPVFSMYHSEHELLRYMHRLQAKDLSLTTSMIPLGSCTMKLNATCEMVPMTLEGFSRVHPFAPADQTVGYHKMILRLEQWLSEITGFAATSLQPNAGSQGEYAGLLAIRAYHKANGQSHRNVCLIPASAHGTNPASAVIAGMKVVAVACDARGDVDLVDLKAKAEAHREDLAALMVTYPSTHGVFEEKIREICSLVHEFGGQVYMDGANMNAQVALCRPGDFGADVCHLNLHKTFCIPHGGGGPGVGPICVAAHLAPFLPGHAQASELKGLTAVGPVSAAPYGSASILTISYVYIALMGAEGLADATATAILNANYMAKRLEAHYPVLYRGTSGLCAHEFILDCRGFEASAGIKVEDIAKRLMDYGYHAPTMSWPVTGTLMIEPTESESKPELDRFCDAMIAIRAEISAIEAGQLDRTDNPLKNAPHTAAAVTADVWPHPYTRQQAAWPLAYLKQNKFWPAVGRVDNPYGDRNLVCSCPPMEAV